MLLTFSVSIYLLAAYYYSWKLEAKGSSSRSIVITPFVFIVYFIWIRFYPNFIIAQELGITTHFYPFFVATVEVFLILSGFLLGAYMRPQQYDYTYSLAGRLLCETGRAKEYDAAMICLTAVLVALTLYFYRGVPPTLTTFLSNLISHSSSLDLHMRALRFAQTKAAYFGGEYRAQGLFAVIFSIGWPIVASYFLIRHIQLPSRATFFYAATSFTLSFISLLSLGSRAPLLSFFLVWIASYSVSRPIRVRSLIYIIPILFVFAIFLSAQSTRMNYLRNDPGISSFGRAVSEMTSRIFLGNATNDILVIDLVCDGTWPLRLGSIHITEILNALPGVQYGLPLGYELYLAINPWGKETTFETGTYLSILYADFGIFGVVVMSFLIGLFIGIFQRLFFSITKWNPYILAAFSGSLFYAVAYAFMTGISGVIAQSVVFGTIICLLQLFKMLLNGNAESYRHSSLSEEDQV